MQAMLIGHGTPRLYPTKIASLKQRAVIEKLGPSWIQGGICQPTLVQGYMSLLKKRPWLTIAKNNMLNQKKSSAQGQLNQVPLVVMT